MSYGFGELTFLNFICKNVFLKINNKEKTILLYDKAELNYMNIQLRAGIIEFDWDNNVVSAGRIFDSIGKPSQNPVFIQGSDEVNPDSLRYNFDTKKENQKPVIIDK